MAVPCTLAFALSLALPSAGAHLAHDRPHIQTQELLRTPKATIDGALARYDLELSADPFEDLVRHDIDARAGSIRGEYRRQPSEAPTAFVTTWTLGRLIEYRDINSNGVYEPSVDTVVHAWPFSGYVWNVTGPRQVAYGKVPAQDVLWAGKIPNGPAMTIEAASAGDLFTDEGARVLPQDLIAYLDVTRFPPRGLGDLFAFDGNVTIPRGGAIDPDRVDENVSAGLVARIPQRLAGLDWGGQATLDGVEQNVTLTLGEPTSHGNATVRPMRINFPLFDRSLHMVFVSAIEYVIPAKRGAGIDLTIPLSAIVATAAGWALRGARPGAATPGFKRVK